MSYKPPYKIVKAVNQAGLLKAQMRVSETLLMGFLFHWVFFTGPMFPGTSFS